MMRLKLLDQNCKKMGYLAFNYLLKNKAIEQSCCSYEIRRSLMEKIRNVGVVAHIDAGSPMKWHDLRCIYRLFDL